MSMSSKSFLSMKDVIFESILLIDPAGQDLTDKMKEILNERLFFCFYLKVEYMQIIKVTLAYFGVNYKEEVNPAEHSSYVEKILEFPYGLLIMIGVERSSFRG